MKLFSTFSRHRVPYGRGSVTRAWWAGVALLLAALPCLAGSVTSIPIVESGYRQMYNLDFGEAHNTFGAWERPVFLWEDEGHMFFSQYDVNFQPTARDCRASHVIISQNIHNFLHLGHDPHAVQAVFAAMNTYIFHTNGDRSEERRDGKECRRR